MADIHGGRVLAGEDSEEDEEDEEEMSFQFNGFGSQSSLGVPRLATPKAAVLSAEKDDEDDKASDEKKEKEQMKLVLEESMEKEVTVEEDDEEEDKTQETKEAAKRASEILETKQKLWQVDESVNGVEVMSNAFVDTVQPSLDATIHRIAELKASQQRLLKMLTEQNTGIRSNKQVADAAVVLEKLPFYVNKLQGIKLAMQEISTSTEKMKRRAESLRIDAQSHAIKKENKRDAQSQWNKLYAAKSTSAQS